MILPRVDVDLTEQDSDDRDSRIYDCERHKKHRSASYSPRPTKRLIYFSFIA